jgi:predicted class III extradiol MEMO1 family dioxygenase/AMMECR1 domain-containing protein
MIELIIIPHAGKQFCGSIRHQVFQLINLNGYKKKHLFYISAIHEMIEIESIYVFNDTLDLFYEYPKKYIEGEHTFEWVRNELDEYFKDIPITNIFPYDGCDYKTVCDILYEASLNDNILFIVIGTTDLIHYGKRFKIPILEFPQCEKIKLEGDFIKYICQNNIKKVYKYYKQIPYICCGFTSILFIMYLAQLSNKRGHVIDYYDSIQSKSNSIDRYIIESTNSDFVSYVGIYFSETDIESKISDLLGLGCAKSIINLCIKKNKRLITESRDFLPTFTSWYQQTNGIFVSTMNLENITSCIGRFESDDKTSAENLFEASQDCCKDSLHRWQNSIRKDDSIKIEILDRKSKWQQKSIGQLSQNDRKKGVYIELGHGATYLPNVWQTHFKTKEEMLKSLLKKASASQEYKKQDRIKLYQSKTIVSDNIKIII